MASRSVTPGHTIGTCCITIVPGHTMLLVHYWCTLLLDYIGSNCMLHQCMVCLATILCSVTLEFSCCTTVEVVRGVTKHQRQQQQQRDTDLGQNRGSAQALHYQNSLCTKQFALPTQNRWSASTPVCTTNSLTHPTNPLSHKYSINSDVNSNSNSNSIESSTRRDMTLCEEKS